MNQYEAQIILACLISNTPQWKTRVLLNQARLETGYFKPDLKSVFNATDRTNAFGMRCAARNKCKNGWSIYSSVFSSTKDRLYRDTIFRDKSENAEEYIKHLKNTNYFIEDGVDKGYSASLKNMVAENRKKDETMISFVIACIGVMGFALIYFIQ